jgi:hypothetical protein
MKTLDKDAFRVWGRQGGESRARQLSHAKRSAIAACAAQARWKKKAQALKLYQSVRLSSQTFEDPVFLQELLSEGGLADWKELLKIIEDRPFGAVAEALEKALRAEKIYGITALWQDLLSSLRDGSR